MFTITFHVSDCKNDYPQSSCDAYKNQGDCTNTWKEWMEKHCPESCGFCGGTIFCEDYPSGFQSYI